MSAQPWQWTHMEPIADWRQISQQKEMLQEQSKKNKVWQLKKIVSSFPSAHRTVNVGFGTG